MELFRLIFPTNKDLLKALVALVVLVLGAVSMWLTNGDLKAAAIGLISGLVATLQTWVAKAPEFKAQPKDEPEV